MSKIEIENIVSSTRIAEHLDLKKIVNVLDNARYSPKRFPGLVYKSKKPKTAMLIFSSGTVVCTGAKTEDELRESIYSVINKLIKAKVKVFKRPKIIIQNIVAVYTLETELNLNDIAIGLGLENIEYEPEQFPGLVYRITQPKVVMLLFSSGSVVCTGAKSIKEIESGINKLVSELQHGGFIH